MRCMRKVFVELDAKGDFVRRSSSVAVYMVYEAWKASFIKWDKFKLLKNVDLISNHQIIFYYVENANHTFHFEKYFFWNKFY